MAIEYTVPRLKGPIGDYSKKLPVALQNHVPHFLEAKPMHEIIFEYIRDSGIGSVHDFIRGFEGLLKSGIFSNSDELKREYMKLGKEYSELKNFIEWIENEKNSETKIPQKLPGLLPAEKEIVLKKGHTARIKRGVRLIREGAKGRKIFFLLNGAVDLFRKNERGNKEHVCQLLEGHVFGEYGAFLDLPRTADVVTTRDSDFFIIDIDTLKDLYIDGGSVFEILKERVFLFKNLRAETGLEPLPFPVIRKFFDDGEVRTFSKNETIFEEGEWGHNVYFILDGDIHILKDGIIRRTLKRGDFFGEIALLKRAKRSAKALTATPSNLLQVDHMHFLRVLSQNLSVALRIEKIIDERIQRF